MAHRDFQDGSQPGTGLTLYKRADDVLHSIERTFALTAALFIFALMLLGVAQVAGRRLFDTPIFGYIDMVELLMTTFAFLAVAYAERIGTHVRMDMLVGRLTGRPRWLIELFAILVALFVVSVLVRYSFDHAMRAYNSGDTTIDAEIQWWPSKLLVSIAFSVLWLRLLHASIGFARLAIWPDATPVGLALSESSLQKAEREAREAHSIGGTH